MNTRVYILGAGASKSDGVPLMNEFISEGMMNWDSEDDPETIFEFFRFAKSVFPEMPDMGTFEMAGYLDMRFGIEKVLSKATELQDNTAGRVIKKFIFKTIENTSEHSYFYSPGHPIKEQFKGCYHKFVLTKIKENNDIVFISFNYDRLLEGALLHCGLGDKFSYLIPPFEIQDNRINFKSYMCEYEGKIKLLKLHGSLNWIFCSNCHDMRLYWFERYRDGYSACPKCNQNSLAPLLIPPVNNKKYPGIIEPLWNKAKEYLREATEIVVIGYSFRNEDDKTRKMAGNALKCNPHLPVLIIVDKAPDKILEIILEILNETKDKFRQIEKFSSFEEFLKSQPP